MYAPVYSVNNVGVAKRSHALDSVLKPIMNRNTVAQNKKVPVQPDRVARPGDLFRCKRGSFTMTPGGVR